MNENIEEIGIFLIIVGFAILGIAGLVSFSNKQEKQNRQKEQQEIQECYNKTDDLNYCLDKFNR